MHNAGIHDDAPLAGMSLEQWHRVMDVTLHGFYHVTQPLLLPMLRTRWGRIISISSVAGVIGNRGQANYAAAKAGLHGASQVARLEVASRGVTVNAVAPGIVADADERARRAFRPEQIAQLVPLQPRRHAGEEVAALVGFLMSERAGLHHRPGDPDQRRHGVSDACARRRSSSPPTTRPRPSVTSPRARCSRLRAGDRRGRRLHRRHGARHSTDLGVLVLRNESNLGKAASLRRGATTRWRPARTPSSPWTATASTAPKISRCLLRAWRAAPGRHRDRLAAAPARENPARALLGEPRRQFLDRPRCRLPDRRQPVGLSRIPGARVPRGAGAAATGPHSFVFESEVLIEAARLGVQAPACRCR